MLTYLTKYLKLTYNVLSTDPSGLDLRKKPGGQLAPKLLDLVVSTIFLVAKNFRPFGPKTFPDLDHFA